MTPEDRCKMLEMQLAEMREAHGVESRIAQRRGEEVDSLFSRVKLLEEALQECSQGVDDKGEACWCHLPSMIPYRGHDVGCRLARAALAAKDTP